LNFQEAERIKAEKGFVSLGGAYEEPDDPQAAAISKISRQVMTRLHIQMNQTIQHFKGQQGGSVPQRLFLSGGASIMPFTAQFFAEKLNIPVDYFNPLRNVDRDPGLNLEELAKVAHSMGELVGLGLRALAHCPVELNLTPRSSLKRQEFNQKKPYILAALFSLVLVVFATAVLEQKTVSVKTIALEELRAKRQPLEANKSKLTEEMQLLRGVEHQGQFVRSLLQDRTAWRDILPVLRECLVATEEETSKELGVETGVWIDELLTELPGGVRGDPSAPPDGAMERPVRIPQPEAPPTGETASPDGGVVTNAPVTLVSTNLITHLIVKIRAIDMTSVKPEGNTTMAFEFLKQLQSRPWMFDTNEPDATGFKGNINVETNTFTTEVSVKLKNPISL
jgi:hypothetical protein